MKCPYSKSKIQVSTSLIYKNRLKEYLALQIELKVFENNPVRGYFGPGSMFWKLFSEPALLLGGHRALLLQLAHPAIADGVKNYSRFQNDFAGRASGTITSMTKIIFGNIQQAKASALKLHQIHAMISGSYWEMAENSVEQKSYNANDPDLLLWVLATMIDTALQLYEITCKKLSKPEKELFYEESKRMAILMGIPLEIYPGNLQEFYTYYNEMLVGEELYAGSTAKKLAHAIFHAPLSIPAVGKSLAYHLLPPRLQKQYQLNRSPRLFEAIIFLARLYYKIIPDLTRLPPPYHQALNRIEKLEKNKNQFPGFLFEFLSRHVRSPFLLPSYR